MFYFNFNDNIVIKNIFEVMFFFCKGNLDLCGLEILLFKLFLNFSFLVDIFYGGGRSIGSGKFEYFWNYF